MDFLSDPNLQVISKFSPDKVGYIEFALNKLFDLRSGICVNSYA